MVSPGAREVCIPVHLRPRREMHVELEFMPGAGRSYFMLGARLRGQGGGDIYGVGFFFVVFSAHMTTASTILSRLR